MKANRFIAITLVFLLSALQSYSQLFVGAGFGTFKKKTGYRGLGPTISVLYSQNFMKESTLFLNTSFYQKKGLPFGTVKVTDNLGSSIGNAAKSVNVTTIHYRFGFMRNFGNKENSPVPNFFLGAGLAWSQINTTYNYDLKGYNIPSEKAKNAVFGFHFSAGMHSQIKKLVIELKGSFDFMLGQDIKEYENDESLPHINSTQLTIYYPLTGQKY